MPNPQASRSKNEFTPRPWQALLLALATAAVAFAVYIPSFNHKFLDWDDQGTVATNPDFNPPDAGKWGHYWTGAYLELYMPLTYMFWGGIANSAYDPNSTPHLDPAVFHCASAALHGLCAAMVFLVLLRLARKPAPAILGAAVFALHPLQVESVDWVTSTSNLLSGFLSLIAIWAYLRFDELINAEADLLAAPPAGRVKREHHRDAVTSQSSVRVWSFFGAGSIAFVLALLSKPSVVMVPILIAVMAVGLRRRRVVSLWPLLIWLAMSIAVALITRFVQPAAAIHVSLTDRILVAIDAIAFYISKLFWPAHLIPDYGRTPAWVMAHPASHWIWALPAILLLLCVIFWKRARWLATSAAVFVVALVPVLGLAVFTYQKYSTVADRYVYLAMLGPAIALAFVATYWRAKWTWIASACLAICLGTLTVIQSRYWFDTVTLFQHTLTVNPRSTAANDALGHWYEQHGEPQRGLAHYQAALETNPHYGNVLYNAGNALMRLNRPKDAIDYYRRAATDSDLEPSVKAQAWDNMGVAEVLLGDFAAAERSFQNALEQDSSYKPAQDHLSKIRGRMQIRSSSQR